MQPSMIPSSPTAPPVVAPPRVETGVMPPPIATFEASPTAPSHEFDVLFGESRVGWGVGIGAIAGALLLLGVSTFLREWDQPQASTRDGRPSGQEFDVRPTSVSVTEPDRSSPTVNQVTAILDASTFPTVASASLVDGSGSNEAAAVQERVDSGTIIEEATIQEATSNGLPTLADLGSLAVLEPTLSIVTPLIEIPSSVEVAVDIASDVASEDTEIASGDLQESGSPQLNALLADLAELKNLGELQLQETFPAPPAQCETGTCPPKLQSHGTALAWADTPAAAYQMAAEQKKLVFLIHVSGNFEIPGFT